MILAIDFNNIVFGSWYGEKLINSHGMNVNAIKGFFFKLKLLKDTFNPDYIVMANDLERSKTFRKILYKPYKDNRKPKDDDIITQMKYVSQISALLGYPFINNEIYEADDILGMIGQYSKENGYEIIIASSDKDLYQLADDNVYIFSPRTRELIDREWLLTNYKLTPDQWIELKMLKGDQSDNIPGINGVGDVTSLKLMQQYGNIENIYKNLSQLKPALRGNLEAGYDRLPLIRELVTIITDYTKIDFNPSMLENKGLFRNEVFELLKELEIPSLFNVMTYSLMVPKPIPYSM